MTVKFNFLSHLMHIQTSIQKYQNILYVREHARKSSAQVTIHQLPHCGFSKFYQSHKNILTRLQDVIADVSQSFDWR